MNFYKSNILAALDLAIRNAEKMEKKLGYTGDSALLAGWRALYKQISEGGQIHIIQQ